MTHDDELYRFPLRLFALAEEIGNVRAACRILCVHPSTYYRWRKPCGAGGWTRCAQGIWNVLRRTGLNARAKRLGLIAGYQATPEPRSRRPEPLRHIEAAQLGDLVELD